MLIIIISSTAVRNRDSLDEQIFAYKDSFHLVVDAIFFITVVTEAMTQRA